MRKIDRTGEVRLMKCGLSATITKYINSKNIDIEFDNGCKLYNVHYSTFANGTARCPMIYNIFEDYVECVNINIIPMVKFIIDLDDLERIKSLNTLWCTDGKGYIINKHTYLHRYLMDCPKGMVVDHINRNKSDYRKNNLRVCTNGENLYNQEKQKRNTSGYKGVCWHKQNNKWKAEIRANNKYIFIGYYDTKEQAAKAYNEAALKYHGEFARLNVINEVQ